jgi:hypothetical protein
MSAHRRLGVDASWEGAEALLVCFTVELGFNKWVTGFEKLTSGLEQL